MASKMVSILVAVVLVGNILFVTGESVNAGDVTMKESGQVGEVRKAGPCGQFGQSCDHTKDCCTEYFCDFINGKGKCGCRLQFQRCDEVHHCCGGLSCNLNPTDLPFRVCAHKPYLR